MRKGIVSTFIVTALAVTAMSVTVFAAGRGMGNGNCCGGFGQGGGYMRGQSVYNVQEDSFFFDDEVNNDIAEIPVCEVEDCNIIGAHTHDDENIVAHYYGDGHDYHSQYDCYYGGGCGYHAQSGLCYNW